jgi:hypothetical protein
MSINGISFWQQDQNFWSRSAERSQSLASSASLMSVMSDAITNLSQGLASIANQTALDRTNTALSAALQSALQGSTTSAGNSSGSSSSSTSSAASGSTSASGSASASASPGDSGAISGPAAGAGTVPLTGGTSLLTFHVIKGGTFSVSDGIGTTVYTSSGSDTVGDVINAINNASPGHAQAFAWLDGSGKLNIAARDTSHTITIGGSAASALGFGAGNNSFQPATSSPGTTTAAASGTSAAGSGQTSNAATPASPTSTLFAQNSAPNLLTGGTAETLLASNGSAGFLVNLLA